MLVTMNKTLVIIAIGLILGITAFVIAEDLIAKPINEKDIKQITKEIKFEADNTSNIDTIFSNVIISSVADDGSFNIFKEGVINKDKKMNIDGKSKIQIEAEAFEIAKAELNNIRPLFESGINNETLYLTDEQIVQAVKVHE